MGAGASVSKDELIGMDTEAIVTVRDPSITIKPEIPFEHDRCLHYALLALYSHHLDG